MAHIGWLGSIPIIGQTQESIEAIISLCRGDPPHVTEEGKQIISAGAASYQPSGSGQITKEDASEIVSRLVITGKSDNAKQMVMDELLKQIQKPDVKPQPATDEEIAQVLATNKAIIEAGVPPKRGDHIFNNNVLKVFRNIIDNFLHSRGLQYMEVMPKVKDSLVYKACEHPMNPHDANILGKILVVHMPDHKDVNSIPYGEHIKKLNEAVVKYMNALADGRGHKEPEQLVKKLVDMLKKQELFIDPDALKYFLSEHKKKEDKTLVANMRVKVEALFNRLCTQKGNDEVIQWVKTLKPFF